MVWWCCGFTYVSLLVSWAMILRFLPLMTVIICTFTVLLSNQSSIYIDKIAGCDRPKSAVSSLFIKTIKLQWQFLCTPHVLLDREIESSTRSVTKMTKSKQYLLIGSVPHVPSHRIRAHICRKALLHYGLEILLILKVGPKFPTLRCLIGLYMVPGQRK